MSDDKYEAVFTTYVHGNGRRAVGRVGVAIIRNADGVPEIVYVVEDLLAKDEDGES